MAPRWLLNLVFLFYWRQFPHPGYVGRISLWPWELPWLRATLLFMNGTVKGMVILDRAFRDFKRIVNGSDHLIASSLRSEHQDRKRGNNEDCCSPIAINFRGESYSSQYSGLRRAWLLTEKYGLFVLYPIPSNSRSPSLWIGGVSGGWARALFFKARTQFPFFKSLFNSNRVFLSGSIAITRR